MSDTFNDSDRDPRVNRISDGRRPYAVQKAAVTKQVVEVDRDPHGIRTNDCATQAGGVKRPSSGDNRPGIVNPETDVWQEETGVPVQENDGQYILVR